MIFVDPTGQRWRNVKQVARAITLALGLPVAAVLAGATLHNPTWSPLSLLTSQKPPSFLSTARDLLILTPPAPSPAPTPTPTPKTPPSAQVLAIRNTVGNTPTPEPPDPTPTPDSDPGSESGTLSEVEGPNPSDTALPNATDNPSSEVPPEPPGNSDFGQSHQDPSPGNSDFGQDHRPTP